MGSLFMKGGTLSKTRDQEEMHIHEGSKAEFSSSYGAWKGLWNEVGAHINGQISLLNAHGQSLSVEGDGDDGSAQAFHGSLMLFTSTKK